MNKTSQIRFTINSTSINRCVNRVKLIGNVAFRTNSSFLDAKFVEAEKRTKDTIMVATGETRNNVFKFKKRANLIYDQFSLGIDPTSNNQSFATEFEDGPVHKTNKEHYYPSGEPKCSRDPYDLYTFIGKRYQANPNARRAALRKSVEEAFNCQMLGTTHVGNNIQYIPDINNLVSVMRHITESTIRRLC